MDSPRFEVSVTAIIRNGDKFLVTRRSANKKRFPGLWTVPGGHVEANDYLYLPHNNDGVSCGVLENAVIREVAEETTLRVDPETLQYIASMELSHGEVVVISLTAELMVGEDPNAVVIDPTEADEFRWVTLDEAKKLPLIAGIDHELELATKMAMHKRLYEMYQPRG